MAKLTPRFPLHISEGIVSFLEFDGDYTRAELVMWAELNSYPYLKRKIAQHVSILLYIGYWLPKDDLEHFFKDETVKLLSKCTSSFFFLATGLQIPPPYVDIAKFEQEEQEFISNDFLRALPSFGLFILDVAKFFGQVEPQEGLEGLDVPVFYAFEFRSLMRKLQFRTENMYLITKWETRKRAIKSFFHPPHLLPTGALRDLQGLDGLDGLECLVPLNIKGAEFLGVPAGKIYLKEGYLCKIESFWMRLLRFFQIWMDSEDWEKSRYSKFPLP